MEGSVEKEEQWGRLGVEWVDPKEFSLYQLIHYRMRNKTTLAVKVLTRHVEAKSLGTFDWHAIQSAWVQGPKNLS